MIWTDKHDEVCCEIFIDKVLKKRFLLIKDKSGVNKTCKRKGIASTGIFNLYEISKYNRNL
ncbi:MAG: hypothetical protein J6J24_00315 [Clostridia bacterium]|nr:hypothetical protein [Clostridia bacterium]